MKNMSNEIPRNVWLGADYLKSQVGVTDLSKFEFDPCGWGGLPRYLLPFNGVTPNKPCDSVTPNAKAVTRNHANEIVTPNALLQICHECGQGFAAVRSNQRFCSDGCKMKDYRKRKSLLQGTELSGSSPIQTNYD